MNVDLLRFPHDVSRHGMGYTESLSAPMPINRQGESFSPVNTTRSDTAGGLLNRRAESCPAFGLSEARYKRATPHFLPAVQKYPNNTAAISGSAPESIELPWTTPGSLATETGQWNLEALPLTSGETTETEHTLAGCPSDRVLTKALGEQSLGTAEKINRTLSGNSLLLTVEYLDVCTGTRAFCRDYASEGIE